jgi:hypothetical protein
MPGGGRRRSERGDFLALCVLIAPGRADEEAGGERGAQ